MNETTETSTDWGRADEDGTVWVRTADGERVVGSWQAGPPAEGLAFFVRKFEGLAAEVALVETRIAAGKDSDLVARVAHVREKVVDAAAVGDLASLIARLDVAEAAAKERQVAARAARADAVKAAVAAKEALVAEAEGLIGSTAWKTAGDRYRAIVEEWKAIKGVDRKTDEAMWKRFAAARSAFGAKRDEHFAALGAQRDEAKRAKTAIVEEAEKVVASLTAGDESALSAATGTMRDLMTKWKATGRAERSVDDALWTKFRAAQDAVYAARTALSASRDGEEAAALTTKLALLTEAEALLPVKDAAKARAALRDIQERWDAAGRVPRDSVRTVSDRLRRVEDAIAEADERHWRRTDPAAIARAESLVAQLEAAMEKATRKGESAAKLASQQALLDSARASLAGLRKG